MCRTRHLPLEASCSSLCCGWSQGGMGDTP